MQQCHLGQRRNIGLELGRANDLGSRAKAAFANSHACKKIKTV
jgi:hypothetical protein